MFYINRTDAGNRLCQSLLQYLDFPVVVYALPRGGVPVAVEIAKFFNAPLDLIFAHKIGHPLQPEYAIAAISESGQMVGPSPRLVQSLGNEWLEDQKAKQLEEIKRKREKYCKNRESISVENKIAILVDDGMATGLTMQVGINELKERHPSKIVAVVPIAPKSAADRIKAMVDDYVGIIIDDDQFFGAVGAYYDDFSQVEDEEVYKLLNLQNDID